MNDAVIIQHVYERSPHVHLLETTFARHARYALVNKMDYHVSMDTAPHPVGGDWRKVELIHQAVHEYDYVIWLDADAMIWDVRYDLRSVCKSPVNCVVFNNPNEHANVGVLYFRRCAASSDFVCEWLSRSPGDSPWFEQGVFNTIARLPQYEHEVGILPAALNCVDFINGDQVDGEPVVKAWHGYSALSSLQIVREKMEQAIKEYGRVNVLGV